MKKKEFWVKVDAGLCNRLRVLISSIGFAELTNRKLFVCWPVTPKWEKWPFRRYPPSKRFEASLSSLWYGPFIEVSVADWETMLRFQGSVESSFPPDNQSQTQRLYLNTIHDFYKVLPMPPYEYAERLKLRKHLENRVDAFLCNWKKCYPTIGVHIRAQEAHEETKNESPVSWFEKRILELYKMNPLYKFFLSTDSSQTSERIHKKFPGLMHEQCIPPGYNTIEGIEKGVVDLYILSQTDYILGSYWSSFSYMAAMLQERHRGYEDSHMKWGSLPT